MLRRVNQIVFLARRAPLLQKRRNHNNNQNLNAIAGFWNNLLEQPPLTHAQKLIDLEKVGNLTLRPMFPTTKLPQLSTLNFTYTIEKQCNTILDNSKSLFKIAYSREQLFRRMSVEERELLSAERIIVELNSMHAIYLRHDLHCAVEYFSCMFKDDAAAMQKSLQDEQNSIKDSANKLLLLEQSKNGNESSFDDSVTINARLLEAELSLSNDKFYSDYISYLNFLITDVEPSILTLAKNINTMTTILSNASFMVNRTRDAALGLQVLDDLIERWNQTEHARRLSLLTVKQGLDLSVKVRQQMLRRL